MIISIDKIMPDQITDFSLQWAAFFLGFLTTTLALDELVDFFVVLVAWAWQPAKMSTAKVMNNFRMRSPPCA
jgi:hypothetical protein